MQGRLIFGNVHNLLYTHFDTKIWLAKLTISNCESASLFQFELFLDPSLQDKEFRGQNPNLWHNLMWNQVFLRYLAQPFQSSRCCRPSSTHNFLIPVSKQHLRAFWQPTLNWQSRLIGKFLFKHSLETFSYTNRCKWLLSLLFDLGNCTLLLTKL